MADRDRDYRRPDPYGAPFKDERDRERGPPRDDRHRSRYDDAPRDRDRERDRYAVRHDDRRIDPRAERERRPDDVRQPPAPPPPEDRRRDFRGRDDDRRPPPRFGEGFSSGGPHFGDRRGGGGGGGSRRYNKDGLGSPDRRSPTPDGALPLSQRKRKASGWDVHAPGYEQYTAIQAKQTGLFNLPGGNRGIAPPIMPMIGLSMPLGVGGMGMGTGNPNLTRQSRRLYIGSITPEITEENLTKFFNSKMTEMGIGTGGPGDPVLAVQVNYEKNYAFVEFRSAEDASAAMAFDGIIFLSGPLRIRRPKDYVGGDYSIPQPMHLPGVISTNVPDSLEKIFVGGLPAYLNEEQVQELLKSFGELKSFNLVRENGNGVSKGFAFFEYVDESVTDIAIQGLTGMELGERTLVVQRASVGAKPGMPGSLIPNPNIPYDQMPEIPRPIMPLAEMPTQDARILLMLNMVTLDDLADDREFGDIFDDIKDECSKFGSVEDLRVPRPVKKDKSKWAPGEGGAAAAAEAVRADEAAGVGRVYVKFHKASDAQTALRSLAGRAFAGRSIIATLLSEDSQSTPPLHLIFAAQPAPPSHDAPPAPNY